MLKDFKIGTRLYGLICCFSVLMIVIGVLGLQAAKVANTGLDKVYRDRVVPLKDLKIIADLYAVNIVDVAHKVRNGNMGWDEGRKSVNDATRGIADKWKEYLATTLVVEEKKLVEEAIPLMKNADNSVAKLSSILAKEDSDALAKFTISELYPIIDPISAKFSELVDVQLKVALEEYDASNKTYNTAKIVSITVLLAGLLLGLGFGRMIVVGITKPVTKTMTLAEAMARGDFSTRLDISQKDEIGDMGKSLNAMAEQLGLMIKEIIEGVSTLSSSSTEMAAVSKQLSSSAGQTSDKSAMVASAAEEMSSNIQSVSAAMEQSTSNVQLVATATEEMTATVNEIGQNAEKARSITEGAVKQSHLTSEKMSALGESAKRIGRVTETITEISEQTNLLALNATIEAARAGDAGKGFAVVANEIKELAKQTAAATINIKHQIDEMQHTTTSTIGDIERISEVIEEINTMIIGIATAVVEQATATTEISTNISQAAQGITEVNENVAQSTVAVANINRDIADINQQSSEVGAGSHQVEINAQGLSALATQLASLVQKFKV